MGIQKLLPQSSVTEPTKPNLASVEVYGSLQQFYYPIINIIGKGKVSRISLAFFNGSGYSGNGELRTRVTVDGGTPVELYSPHHTTALSIGGGSDIGRRYCFDLIQEISFNSSIKIEMAQTNMNGGSNQLCGVVEYTLV